MIKLKSLLENIQIYSTHYLGNCVNLMKQFDLGDDSTEPAMWMLEILGDDDNVYRITTEHFFKFVNINQIPKKASKGKELECYYIFHGHGHPMGGFNFVLYSVDNRGNDIHYFIDVSPDPEDIIKTLPKLPNGYGCGQVMTEN
jgi:hypothetical protein